MPAGFHVDFSSTRSAHLYVELLRTFATASPLAAAALSNAPLAFPRTVWNTTTLHHFTDKPDGQLEWGSLLLGPGGVLFGTATAGGSYGFGRIGNEVYDGFGTIFEVIPPVKGQLAYTTRVLHSLTGGLDGRFPYGALISDKVGNLFGITTGDGNYRGCPTGALYGLTYLGGDPRAFAGTAFALTPAGKKWNFHLLHTFSGTTDGGNPYAAPILDAKGNVYATTVLGGSFFEGTVFVLAGSLGTQHAWMETVLHNFGEGKDGAVPHGTLIFDRAGALYGTAFSGGSSGLGMAFQLSPPSPGQHTWIETELADFKGGAGGDGPNAALIFDSAGSIYGTTSGSPMEDFGTVFKLTR